MPSSIGPILIGIGGNLPGPYGPPRATLGAALEALEALGARIVGRSPWYESAPVPASDQPWFVNGVVQLETALEPAALLAAMLTVEQELGRLRGVANAARTVDLDLLDYAGRISGEGDPDPILPHPRIAQRAFVVLPLMDLMPTWRHPVSQAGIADLAAALPADQQIRKMPDADGLWGTDWHAAER